MSRGRARFVLAAALGISLVARAASSSHAMTPAPSDGGVGGRGPSSSTVPGGGASTPASVFPEPILFEPGLGPQTDILLLPPARRPGPRPAIMAATRVAANWATVTALLLSPATLREALPSLVRADVVATRPGSRPDAWPDRLLVWELEVPLFNLTGHAWLRQRPGGADLDLIDGAFAPGQLRLRATPTTDGHATILTCWMRVEVQSTNWIFRKVARHDAWAETAMSAATAWVMVRALGVRAEAPPGVAPSRPRDAIQPPPAKALDTAFLGGSALAGLRAAGVVAAVRRAPTGRLAWTAVAVTVPGAPGTVAPQLATPETWAVFPGWKSVKRRSTPAAMATVPPTNPGPPTIGPPRPAMAEVSVEDDVSLVDLDAVWSVELTPPGRATAVQGDTKGAVFGWQTTPGDAPASSIAILSMHPHLDAAGFVERKLIAAEPLLEHAFALALAYVDAAAVADRFDRAVVPAASPARAPSGTTKTPAARP